MERNPLGDLLQNQVFNLQKSIFKHSEQNDKPRVLFLKFVFSRSRMNGDVHVRFWISRSAK